MTLSGIKSDPYGAFRKSWRRMICYFVFCQGNKLLSRQETYDQQRVHNHHLLQMPYMPQLPNTGILFLKLPVFVDIEIEG